MKKVPLVPRNDWEKKCNDLDFYFHSIDGRYWIEDYAMEFTQKEVDKLKKAGNEIQSMCLDLASDIVKKGDLDRYQIDPFYFPAIEKSWNNQEFHLYGRFDISYDGKGEPKLLEYNADTPTSLIESSKIQEDWCKDHQFSQGQFNDIHKNLIKNLTIWKNKNSNNKKIHVACDHRSQEEWCNLEYLKEIIIEAGIDSEFLTLEEISWSDEKQSFLDLNGKRIDTLFKLYPWEFLIKDQFYPYIQLGGLNLIEPMWKMLLSTKTILPLLWEKHKEHPNLLPAFFEEEEMKNYGGNYVKKPLYSREGENVEIYDGEKIVDTQWGTYGFEGFIYQQRKDVACFDNRYSMLGLWIIGNETSAIGIREDVSIITKDTSWFIPHYIKG